MTGPHITPDIIAAAEFERDQRAAKFPKLIADQKAGPLFAHLDWQSWVAIAEWLRHGRSVHINAWGGTDDEPRTLDWPTIQTHAAKALEQIEQLLGKANADPKTPADAIDGIIRRRDALAVIEYLVRRKADLAEATARMIAERRRIRHDEAA